MMQIQRIKEISDQEVYQFLSYCMSPKPERIIHECKNYKTLKNRELYGIYFENELTGIIGLIHHTLETELKHIAVHPNHGNKGLGSKLIEEIQKLTSSAPIIAETDREAVNFYKKNGFIITSLGEKYPGVERFKCIYNFMEA